jgi:alkylation response protein AidB-like acyl-CoA dehydrogenase
MDVALSDSETLLRETARRLGSDLACSSVADYANADSGRAWHSLAQTGMVGIRLPEAVGGGDGTTLDQALVVESLAYHAVAVPYLGSAAFVGELLLSAGAPKETLERLATGELRIALGLSSDFSSFWQEESNSGDVVAFDSAGADAVLVLVPESGGVRLRAVGIGALLPGFDLTRSFHSSTGGEVNVGDLGGVMDRDAYDRALARCMTLVSADLVGVMDVALTTAVNYAKTREQFGVAIATFQAVQHLCAEQLVTLEGARSLTEYAAWAVDELSTDEALLAARSAKAYASRAGRVVTEAVVQVHGGMAFTWDCMAHVYLKRALTDGLIFGNYARQINEIALLRSNGRP